MKKYLIFFYILLVSTSCLMSMELPEKSGRELIATEFVNNTHPDWHNPLPCNTQIEFEKAGLSAAVIALATMKHGKLGCLALTLTAPFWLPALHHIPGLKNSVWIKDTHNDILDNDEESWMGPVLGMSIAPLVAIPFILIAWATQQVLKQTKSA